jgi:hypothetical protein
MPISDRYQVIFIHIPKCAGISVWVGMDLSICECNLISTSPPILQHLLPKQLKNKYISKKKWKAYKKITIVRNPYDRVVSDYFWLMKTSEEFEHQSFDEFLDLREDVVHHNKYADNMYYDHFYPMYFYFEDITYDHVFRFENLDKDFLEIKKIFKIVKDFTKNNSTEHAAFVLSAEQKDRIYALYETDFLQFGYSREYKSGAATQKNLIGEPDPAGHSNNHNFMISDIFNKETLLVQAYMPGNDMQYSEENSVTLKTDLKETPGVFSIDLPGWDFNTGRLRIDLGVDLGLFNLYGLRLKNKANIVFWELNKLALNVHDWSGVLFIKNDIQGDTITCLTVSGDSKFFLEPFSSDQYDSFALAEGICLEIELASPNEPQISGLFASAYLSERVFNSLRSKTLELSERITFLELQETEYRDAALRMNETILQLHNQTDKQEAEIQLFKILFAEKEALHVAQENHLKQITELLNQKENAWQHACQEKQNLHLDLENQKQLLDALNAEALTLREVRTTYELTLTKHAEETQSFATAKEQFVHDYDQLKKNKDQAEQNHLTEKAQLTTNNQTEKTLLLGQFEKEKSLTEHRHQDEIAANRAAIENLNRDLSRQVGENQKMSFAMEELKEAHRISENSMKNVYSDLLDLYKKHEEKLESLNGLYYTLSSIHENSTRENRVLSAKLAWYRQNYSEKTLFQIMNRRWLKKGNNEPPADIAS